MRLALAPANGTGRSGRPSLTALALYKARSSRICVAAVVEAAEEE
jgi:hypothetical protein